VIGDVLNQFVPTDVEDEEAPSGFRFARAGKLVKVFTDAGAIKVTEQKVPFRIEHPIDIEGFWTLRTETSDTFRGKLSQLDSKQVAEAKAATADAVAEYFSGGQMKFPAQVLVVSAQKK
jgi:hypothetical protein